MSASHDRLQLELHLALEEDADPEELDAASRQLRAELVDAGLEATPIAVGWPPEGAKSGAEAFVLGAMALSVLPVALPSVVALLNNWSARGWGRPRRVRLVRGEGAARVEVEIDAHLLTAEELQTLLERLVQPAASSGAAIQGGGDVTVGQDVVGRDKITHLHIHAEPGSNLTVNPPA